MLRVQVVVAMMALSVTLVGCAGKHKERIALLEAANGNLTSRLNMTTAELDRVRQDQEYLDRRLVAALNDAQDLRYQLENQAAVPVQEPVAEATAPGWTAVPGGAMITIEGSVLFSPGKVTSWCLPAAST